MKVYTEYFHTESEALAFVRGVELVNDSDVTVCGPRLQDGFEEGEENAIAVAVHDGGPIMEDDTCPLCGACDSKE
jgi:CO dehydrogenase/acetyl-CoA synthase beta subunit